MRHLFFVTVCLLLLTAPVLVDGAIYKWVDEDGTIHFTDSPPAAGTEASVVTPQPNRVEGYGRVPERSTEQGAEITEVDRRDRMQLPIVELFVTSWCGYCKKAEAYFRQRNIPFVKYDIEKDPRAAQRKKSLTNSRGVPFVLIGEVGIPGYSEAAFEKALRQYR